MCRVFSGLTLSLVAVFMIAGVSSASTVSYIAGNSIWLSDPTGVQKQILSGPTADGRLWSEQAQADNGKIVAVRREPDRIATLNSFTLFGPRGGVLQSGSLTNESGWTSSAFPVSLDLTDDGVAVYGYSNMNPGFPMGTFDSGTYVRTVEQPYILPPYKISGREWPTLFGKRVIASKDSIVYVQPSTVGPFSDEFVGFLEVPAGVDINRTDVAANGKVFAIELNYSSIELHPIDRVADTGQAATVGGGGCVLPTVGEASHATISQDGKDIAWQDDRGVLSAGIPDFLGADPCNLTREPVVLAANGKYPSIGGAVISSPGGVDSGGSPVPKVPKRIKAIGLRKGVWIKVKVARAGKITVVGKVQGRVVARGSARAKKAGTVRLKLKAVGKWAKKLKRLKGKTLVIKVTSAGKSKTVKRVLR